MPEHDDFILPSSPSARQALTYQERQARRTLMLAAGKLSLVRSELWTLHVSLELPEEEAREISAGRKPENLAFAIQGAIECVNRDNLDGAIKTLEEAALVNAEDLREEWEERQKAEGR